MYYGKDLVIYSFPRPTFYSIKLQLERLGKSMSNTATWKVLEDMMLELRKKSVAIPSNVINDLRSAKLMIEISEAEGCGGEDSQKVEEYLRNIESNVITEAQKVLSSETVDQWLYAFGRSQRRNMRRKKG